MFKFFHTDTANKFWKDVNGIIHGKDDHSFNQARVISVTKASVQQAKDFHGFNGVFVVSCEWNLFLVVVNSNGIIPSLPALSNACEKVKIFKIIK